MGSLHKQVPCRVTAYVDSGIKPLVEVLNCASGFWSFQSCEGSDNEPAYVELLYKGIRELEESDFMVMASTVHKLVAGLARELAGQEDEELIGINIRVALQWCGNLQYPSIRIELQHDYINAAVKLFSRIGICDKSLSS